MILVKLVTEISPFINFYLAEDYRRDYFKSHGERPYCQYVIRPNVEEFQIVFKDILKK